jgi:peptide/nickel transport system permease protein
LTLVTIVALNLGVLLGATVIIEQVFALPGVGSLLLAAINQRDEPVVEGIVLCLSTAVIVMSLLADILYVVLDPRIRHGVE